MLQTASRISDDALSTLAPGAGAMSFRPHLRPLPTPAFAADRYGAGRGPHLPAIGAVILAHVALIALFLHVRQDIQRREEAKLTVVNLTPPPPPPPAAPETDAAPPSPRVAAPPPVVQVPLAPPPMIRTAPAPAATVPVTASPAPAPSSSAAMPVPPAPPAPPAIVQADDLGTQMISAKPPRYPVESRRKHEQGIVALSLVLGFDGTVESIGIAHSSGFPRLDNAAHDAVKGWRWKPVLRAGQPVRVRGVVEIPFVLRSGTA